jgi:cell division protein FtsB
MPKLQYFNEDGSQEFWTDDTDMKSKVLTDLKKDLINVVERIDELNTKISKLKYDSSIEEKAKQMTLEKLNSQDQ